MDSLLNIRSWLDEKFMYAEKKIKKKLCIQPFLGSFILYITQFLFINNQSVSYMNQETKKQRK